MNRTRDSKAQAAPWLLVGKFGLVLGIGALILSGMYWFEVITGDAGWRTWFLAIGFLILPILLLEMDRQGRRIAAQRHRNDP